jgi:hypothetical protein
MNILVIIDAPEAFQSFRSAGQAFSRSQTDSDKTLCLKTAFNQTFWLRLTLEIIPYRSALSTVLPVSSLAFR